MFDEPEREGVLAVRSFVVRALLEDETPGAPRWHGFVTDVATGRRRPWGRAGEVARFLDQQLADAGLTPAATARAAMSAPPLTDVVTDMLGLLQERLPPGAPGVPDSNVTLARVRERLVGLGNRWGTERSGDLGRQELRGGRLDATVRFQLWGASASAVDDAVLALHSDVLAEADQLRAAGFLKLLATDTTLAEHLEPVGAWRKSASYEVLYEYRYLDGDAAESLLVRIPVRAEQAAHGGGEATTVTDGMARWDEEAAAALALGGPRTIARLSALAFVPAAVPSGDVTLARTDLGDPVPPVLHGDLASFLAAVSGTEPAQPAAQVTLPLSDLLAALPPTGAAVELGDRDEDGVPDAYAASALELDPPVVLRGHQQRFSIAYADADGFDEPAVVYLRLGPP